MATYVLNTTNASMKQWVQVAYEFTLNGISNSQIALDGVSGGYKAEFDVGSVVDIYKGSTLKFRGTVFDKDDMTSGGVILTLLGIEHELAESKSPMVGALLTRTWTTTSDHTILNTLVTSVSGWTIDTSNSTSANVDFRTSISESVWNAAIRLISDGGKDILVDQANKKIYLYDELTRSDKFAFIEGKNASNISRKKSRSKAALVTVYGKGDGENMIKGSSGSGVPEHIIIDKNIVTTTQADARALVEYNKLNPQQKSYSLSPTSTLDGLQVGDMGNITNNSAGINEEVDIVRMKTVVDGTGNEKLTLQVTNPAFRLASKNVNEEISKQIASYDQSQASMQGSGNVNVWGQGINAKTNFALKVPFNVSASEVQDEAGNLRVNSLTVDYDIDKFKNGYGAASYTGSDPQVKHDSDNTEPPVENNTDDTTPTATAGVSVWSSNTVESALHAIRAVVFAEGTIVGSPSYYTTRVIILLINVTGGAVLVTPKVETPSTTVFTLATNYSQPDGSIVEWDSGESNASNAAGFFYFWDDNYNATQWYGSAENVYSHTHGGHVHAPDTMVAQNHLHANGDYDIDAADLDSISIADDVDEAGAVNATSVNLYLDFWNGSAWDNKHSILNTGNILERDVDISDSGTYPDAVGLWRVRVEPITATADFAQGIVKLNHELDA